MTIDYLLHRSHGHKLTLDAYIVAVTSEGPQTLAGIMARLNWTLTRARVAIQDLAFGGLVLAAYDRAGSTPTYWIRGATGPEAA